MRQQQTTNNESNSMDSSTTNFGPCFVTISYGMKIVPMSEVGKVLESKTRQVLGGFLVLTFEDKPTEWIMLERDLSHVVL